MTTIPLFRSKRVALIFQAPILNALNKIIESFDLFPHVVIHPPNHATVKHTNHLTVKHHQDARMRVYMIKSVSKDHLQK